MFLAACGPTENENVQTVESTLPPIEVVESPSATEAPEATPDAAPTTEELPTETPPAGDQASLDDFTASLQNAIDARDFAALQGMMADPFTVGYWLSEGASAPPSEAITQFESNFLPEGAQIVWADPDTDLTQVLQGQPAESVLPPDKEPAATLLSYGWGEGSAAEAIHYVTRQTDGTFKWEYMLYSGFGFIGLPTDVTEVVINSDEATFYDGPGDTYNPVATVFGGLPYPVTGVSQDGEWWRLTCFGDNNELIPQCWVSAEPAVTSPTTLP
jgi:hypothetical protein